MADVVQQRGHPDGQTLSFGGRLDLPHLFQRRERAPGQMIGAERVLETAVSGAGVDQEGVAHLTDIPKTLDGGGIESQESGVVYPDVVPEGVADDFRGGKGGRGGQGRRVEMFFTEG
jgi:hypothetical protein